MQKYVSRNGWWNRFWTCKTDNFKVSSKDNRRHFSIRRKKVLNVNIPAIKVEDCKGFKITKAGYRKYGNDSHRHLNSERRRVLLIGLHPSIWVPSEDKSCDFEAINDNFVSITPVKLDMTSYNDINKTRKLVK